MFATTFSQPRAMHSLASAYQQVGLETATANATPHKLIEMLFDGFQDAVARARGAMQARQIEARAAPSKTCRDIVEEGLKAGLNLADGGKLAAGLDALYAYVGMRLTFADLHKRRGGAGRMRAYRQTGAQRWTRSARASPMRRSEGRSPMTLCGTPAMPSQLLNYYEAIEQASQDMLEAARSGNWDRW